MATLSATSPLSRLLAGAPSAASGADMDFAERLSLWIDAFGAIRLQAAHQAMRAHGRSAAGTAVPAGLRQELQQVRSMLATMIAQPVPDADEGTGDYTPYRQRHLELQRQMDLSIDRLRSRVREAFAAGPPRLRQLVLLEVALAEVLEPHEQAAFAAWPALLQRQCETARAQRAHEDEPAPSFQAEWRDSLLAELDLRLAPVTGLVEALDTPT